MCPSSDRRISSSNQSPCHLELKEEFGDETLVGVGSVLNIDLDRQCAESGAKFIVTPGLNFEVIEYCKREDILVCAGALTPSEINLRGLVRGCRRC